MQQESTVSFLSIGGCIAGNFLLRCASSSALAVAALYLAHIDTLYYKVPATFLGLLAVAFYSTELIFSPVFGSLSDRIGRRPFLWFSGAFGACGALLLSFAPALPLFILAKVAQGLSTASSVPAVLGHLAAATSHSVAVRGRVMVLFETATVLGFAVGFALGGILWDRIQVASFYVVALLYGSAMVVFVTVRQRPAAMTQQRGWQFYRMLLRHAPTLNFTPAWIGVNAILGLWFTHLGFQMARINDPSQLLVGGFSGSEIGLVLAAIAIVFVVGTAGWALAFGRIPTTTIMASALMALALFCLVLYTLNHTPEGAIIRIGVLITIVVLILLAVSGFTPAALAYLAEISEHFPDNRGGMMGLYSVFLGVGQLLGGWVGGFFAESWGVDGLIFATALLGLASNASLYLITRSPARDKQPLQETVTP